MWLALVTLGVALFVNQWTTMRQLKNLILAAAPNEPVASLGQNAWRLLAASWTALLTPSGVAAGAVVLVAIAYLVRAEMTGGAVTALFARAEQSNRTLFGLLGLAAVVIARAYVAPGQVFMGDSETHMLRSWMFVEHFRQGTLPIWSNVWYGGFPLLANYGPLYFIGTALLTLAFGDIHTATKVILWACHVGSVFTMWSYLRLATGHRLAALVGALAFALSFHRFHILIYQGDLQVAVMWLLLPTALWIVERSMRGLASPRATFVWSALLWAFLILVHQGYAFFGLVFLTIYTVARAGATPWTWAARLRPTVLIGLSLGAAVAISAFLLIPYVLETSEFRGMPGSPLWILVPNPLGPIMLVKLFKWAAVGDGGTLGYVGLSVGFLAVVGARFGLRHRDPVVIALIASAVASLLMVRNNVSYNVKNVDFFMCFVAALSAWALPAARHATAQRWTHLRQVWGTRSDARVAVLAAALLLADLGLTTFQSPFREGYDFKDGMYARLSTMGPYKTIERQVLKYDPNRPPDAYFDPNKLGMPSAYATFPTPLGFFHEGAGGSFAYSAEMVKQLNRDLNAGRVSDITVRGLYVMGVGQVSFRDRYQWFTPALEPSPLFSVHDDMLSLAHRTPLIVSRSVVPLRDVEGYPSTDLIRERRYSEPETFDYSGQFYTTLVRPILERMDIDMARGVAATLVSRDPLPPIDARAGDAPAPGPIDIAVTRFDADLSNVTVEYRANQPLMGELPYTYFPYLRVTLDQQPVPFYRSAMGMVLVQVPSGAHTIAIAGGLPPMQASMFWVSLASLVGTLALPARLLSVLAVPRQALSS